MDWSDEELIYDLSGRIWENATVQADELLKILLEIFKRIPQEAGEILLDERDPFFILPIANSPKQLAIHFSKSDIGEDGFGIKTQWIVMLVSDLIGGDHDHFIYVVTHELAHVYLEHGKGTDTIPKEAEHDADRLVIEWGFEKELRASPDNYLYSDNEYARLVRKEIKKKSKAKGVK